MRTLLLHRATRQEFFLQVRLRLLSSSVESFRVQINRDSSTCDCITVIRESLCKNILVMPRLLVVLWYQIPLLELYTKGDMTLIAIITNECL